MTQDELTVYLSNIASKKNTNVTTSLERIKLLRNVLALHGYDLGLALSNSSPNTINSSDSTLEAVVSEYNKIIKRNIPNVVEGTDTEALKVDSTQVVRVESGYYPTAFTITGASSSADIEEALNALKKEIMAQAAKPSEVITGAKAIVITENPTTKELKVTYTDGTVGASYSGKEGETDTRLTAGNKDTSGNLLLKTAENAELSSNIPYHEGGTIEAKITVKEGATIGDNPEDVTVIETTPIPQGYYSSDILVMPVLNTGSDTNKVINVQTDLHIRMDSAGPRTVNPSTGFDYIKNVQITVQEGTSKVTATASGNTIKLTPSVSEGWINDTTVEGTAGTTVTANLDGSYTVILPTSTSDGAAVAGKSDLDSDGKQELIVTPAAGYFDGNTAVKVTLNDKEIKYLTEIPDVETTNGVHQIVIPTSIVDGPLTKELEDSKVVISTTGDATDTQTLTSKVTYITTNAGYTTGEAKKLTIQDASAPELTTGTTVVDGVTYDTVLINIENGGWAEGQTDITEQFLTLANLYANGLVDSAGGLDTTETVSTEGQVLFTYADNLDEVTEGILVRIPSNGYKYFTSAKVDLSNLIKEIDII